MSSARADFSGSERRHCSSSTARMACSTLRIRPSRSFIRSRGTLPAASQRSAMSRKACLAASRSVTGSSASASTSSCSLTSALAANSCVQRGVGGVAGAEEGVLGAAEPLPQRVVDVLGRRAGGLPLAHQVAVAAGGRAPVGRVGERLGLLGQPLLDDAGAVALLVLLGEVRLAAPGVGRARGREPAPQRVVGGPVDAGERLPLVEQLAQPVGAVAPVVALGELLGLGDDLSLAALASAACLRPARPCGPRAGAAMTGPSASSRPASDGEVADGVGVGDLAAHGLDRLVRLLGRRARRR